MRRCAPRSVGTRRLGGDWERPRARSGGDRDPRNGAATTRTYIVGMSVSVALVVKLVSKPETSAELGEVLTGALDLANDEVGTPVWFALRSDETTFWIVDAFPGDGERQAHLSGPIAAALMENAERLLAQPPEISPSDVLAAKVS